MPVSIRSASTTSLALAGAALAFQPTLAAAQEPCVTEAEVSAMVVYAAPLALRGLGIRCAGQFAADGFMATSGADLAARYAVYSEAAFPEALSALMAMVGNEADRETVDMLRLLRQMPPSSLRPFVDELVVQKVTSEIAFEDCNKIERVVQALAPLEPDEAGFLASVITGLSPPKNFAVCAMEP